MTGGHQPRVANWIRKGLHHFYLSSHSFSSQQQLHQGLAQGHPLPGIVCFPDGGPSQRPITPLSLRHTRHATVAVPSVATCQAEQLGLAKCHSVTLNSRCAALSDCEYIPEIESDILTGRAGELVTRRGAGTTKVVLLPSRGAAPWHCSLLLLCSVFVS